MVSAKKVFKYTSAIQRTIKCLEIPLRPSWPTIHWVQIFVMMIRHAQPLHQLTRFAMGQYATKFATVTKDDREWLRKQWKSGETHTARCRARAYIHSSQHLSAVEISLILAVIYETVSSWLDRWEGLGRDGILDADRPESPPISDQKDLDAVRKSIQEHPPEPSVILNDALKETDKTSSRSTRRRAIKRMGIRWKLHRLSLKKQRNSRAFQKASQQLKTLVESKEVNVVYLVEAHFSASCVVCYAWKQRENECEFLSAVDLAK